MIIKKENGWKKYSEEEKKWAFEFSEYYKKFLDKSKTEREFVENGIAMAEKKGFRNAEEFEKFKRKRKHNDTDGITGINHILGTINQRVEAKEATTAKESFYNLWYDTKEEKRYSYVYKGKKEVLDNILVSTTLLKGSSISYIHKSITPFEKEYLFKKEKPYRWEISQGKVKKHTGKGYSDHLALIAQFKVAK